MSDERLPGSGKTVAFIGRLIELPMILHEEAARLGLPGYPGYWPDTPLSTYDPLSDPLNDPFPEERY